MRWMQRAKNVVIFAGYELLACEGVLLIDAGDVGVFY
jgi:hypothetical protein